MKILHIDFTEEEIQEWCDYLNMWIPVEQTPESVKETIEMFPDDGGKWIVQSSHDIGFETGEREMFMKLWAIRNCGTQWPIGADSEEVKDEFKERLEESTQIDKAIEKLRNS